MTAIPSRLALVAAASLALAGLSGCKKDEPPAPAPSDTATPAAPAEQSVEDWVRKTYADPADPKSADMGPVLYAKAEVDLDNDGTPEELVYVGGPMLCGTGGCNLVVLKRKDAGFEKVGDMSVVQLPVGVLDTTMNGWTDLAVSVAGGGNPGGIMKLSFDGKSYPDNPTVAPATPVNTIGTVVIPEKPLKPLP